MRTPAKIHAILFTINFVYALNYVVIKEIVPSVIGPLAMLFFRALGGFIFFTTLHLLFYKEKLQTKHIPKIILCSIFGIALNGIFFLKGIALTVPINASLIMILVPVIVMVISYFLLKERVTWLRKLGALIGLVGAVILITKLEPLQFSSATVKGDIFIFFNAISFATYLVLVQSLLQSYRAITMARYFFTFGLIIIIPICLPELQQLDLSVFDTIHWLAFAFVIIFPTLLAYYLYNVALKTVQPSVASSYIFLQPFLTAIIALSLGKDELTTYKIIGGILIFVGLAFVNFGKSKQLKIIE